MVTADRLLLLPKNTNDLRKQARDLGLKVNYSPLGGTEVIIQKIVEKNYLQPNAAEVAVQQPVALTIHDKFHLINVLFSEELVESATQCNDATS